MQIDSNYIVSNIEQHFKVSAGPGAGKTHWLVQHIKNVLHNSNRLSKTRKIACITYTNVAVETILERLGNYSDHVEVSTIHSFLYKHIVKPYAVFIADEYGLNVEKMDGHDEHIVSYSIMSNWINNHPQQSSFKHPYTIDQLLKLPNNKQAISQWLSSTSYKLTTNDIIVTADRSKIFYLDKGKPKYLRKECIDLLEPELIEYKKGYWSKGILHHDDILFFSYRIIQDYPFVLEVLRAKFPYFFLDEFQDSSPIQVEIIKKIGERETTIGIIGDIAQSIYEFQGADPSQYSSFTLNGIQYYEMIQNRRSTNSIIDALNLVRSDLKQTRFRNEQGDLPKILCGDRIAAYIKAQEYSLNEDVVTLSRKNITANAMKQHYNGGLLNNKLFSEFQTQDSNSERRLVVISCIKGIELAREQKFKDAIKEMMAIYKNKIRDKEVRKKQALNDLHFLMVCYEEIKELSLLNFYSFLRKTRYPDISTISKSKGIAKVFYESHSYQDMALCVRVLETLSLHRTIHNAKGDEFNNVLLILNEEKDLNFLHSSDLQKEEHRIAYVALSRAKERLFISTPSLEPKTRKKLEGVFCIEDV